MKNRVSQPHTLNQTGQNLIRIVIASYFLAVALELIPGTSALPLTGAFLPEPYASFVGKAVIFTCAYFVLVGACLRISALMLATIVFWSSYIANVGLNLENFWRDLALIAALMLTYTQTLPRAERHRGPIHFTPTPRKLDASTHVKPRRVLAPHSRVTPTKTISPIVRAPEPVTLSVLPAPVRLRLVEAADTDNIFRDDPDVAMAS